MLDESFPIQYIAIVITVFIALLFGTIVLIVVIAKRKNKTNYPESKEAKRPLTEKQLKYIDCLKKESTSSAYTSVYYIGKSTYLALAEFVKEVFSYEIGTPENYYKIKCLINKRRFNDFEVLPDEHPDIIWPLANTNNFHRDRHDAWWFFKELMRCGDKITIFFIKNKNDLSKLLEFYFNKANIEIHTLKRIKPFSDDANRYVFIDPYSEEFAITYFLIRNNLKMKDALGMKFYSIPENGSFKLFREKAYKRYGFKDEKEFIKSLIGHLFSADQIYASFYARDRKLIEELAQAFNYDRSDAGAILSKYRKIENEIRIELFGSKMKTYKTHLKRFKKK